MLPGALAALVSVAEPVETIVTMEAAAQSRLLDALAVAMERPAEALGCAYLLGYVAECTLKAALARVLGIPPAAPLWTSVRAAIRGTNGHDLTALLAACLAQRRPSLTPLSAAQVGVWQARVGAIALSSAVEFRYRSLAVPAVDLEPMVRDVEWIVAHAPELWT